MALRGILNIDKPSGPSSREVVDRVEQITRPAKAGHAGTLDPLASGVLVICVGQATRLIEYIQQQPKLYQATFLLGRRSETDDVDAAVSQIADAPVPTLAMLERILPQFRGPIEQRPPAHSAVKVAGRRAYQLARAGRSVELAPRTVMIHRLAICRYEYPELEMEIECGSGTYVRALGRDLAAALGTAAVMSALRRRAIGPFRIDEALELPNLTAETVRRSLLPAITAVEGLTRVELSEPQLTEIRHGRPIPLPAPASRPAAQRQAALQDGPASLWAAVNTGGELVAILQEKHVGQLWPVKNFL